MEKNTVEPDRTEMTIWGVFFVCWITKATDTHSEHVILTDFTLKQRLHKRALMLRFTCIDRLVYNFKCNFSLEISSYVKEY